MPSKFTKLLDSLTIFRKRRPTPEELFEPSGIDYLSTNHVLPLICSYLEPRDVYQCKKMNKVPIELSMSLGFEPMHTFLSTYNTKNRLISLQVNCEFFGMQKLKITESNVIIRGTFIPGFWRRFFLRNSAVRGKPSKYMKELIFSVESVQHGLQLVLDEILPHVHFREFNCYGNPSHLEETILNSFMKNYFGRSISSVKMNSMSDKFAELLNRIGCDRLKIDMYYASDLLLQLDTSKMLFCLKFSILHCERTVMESMMKEWQAGVRDFATKCVLNLSSSDVNVGEIEASLSSYSPFCSILKREKDDSKIVIVNMPKLLKEFPINHGTEPGLRWEAERRLRPQLSHFLVDEQHIKAFIAFCKTWGNTLEMLCVM